MPTYRNTSTSPLVILVAMVVVVAALHLAKEILLPLALAILLSFLLTPLLSWVERLRLGRVASVLIVAGLAFSVIGLLGWIVSVQVMDIGRELPQYRANLVEKIRAVTPRSRTLAKGTDTIEELSKEIAGGEADAGHSGQTRPENENAPLARRTQESNEEAHTMDKMGARQVPVRPGQRPAGTASEPSVTVSSQS